MKQKTFYVIRSTSRKLYWGSYKDDYGNRTTGMLNGSTPFDSNVHKFPTLMNANSAEPCSRYTDITVVEVTVSWTEKEVEG